ncbi:MAG: nitrogenase component 1, partial [Planctomycetota bacterium]
DYEGMMPEMPAGTLVIDDITQHETEMLLEKYNPAIFCAGIKEKYAIQKNGVPCLQLHSYDYGGPFATFQGAVNFYHTVADMVTSPVWGLVTAPWQRKREPELTAELISA